MNYTPSEILRITGLDSKRKIHAIKGLRAVATIMGFHLGLKDAKLSADQIERGIAATMEIHDPQLLLAVKAVCEVNGLEVNKDNESFELLQRATRTHWVSYDPAEPEEVPHYFQ